MPDTVEYSVWFLIQFQEAGKVDGVENCFLFVEDIDKLHTHKGQNKPDKHNMSESNHIFEKTYCDKIKKIHDIGLREIRQQGQDVAALDENRSVASAESVR